MSTHRAVGGESVKRDTPEREASKIRNRERRGGVFS